MNSSWFVNFQSLGALLWGLVLSSLQLRDPPLTPSGETRARPGRRGWTWWAEQGPSAGPLRGPWTSSPALSSGWNQGGPWDSLRDTLWKEGRQWPRQVTRVPACRGRGPGALSDSCGVNGTVLLGEWRLPLSLEGVVGSCETFPFHRHGEASSGSGAGRAGPLACVVCVSSVSSSYSPSPEPT